MALPETIETPITRMLGIRYPVVVAPMFLVSTPALVEATARAGGIGAIPILNFRTPEGYRAFLDGFPQELPFGVNVILKWSDRLEEDLRATVARKVPLVITSLGDPTQVVQEVHRYGGKVWCDVISLRHAEKAAKAGADALVAVGAGAGGHAGRTSPLVLTPWLKEATGLPVVLAGGLATGRQLWAARVLGADAGYFGTRFISSEESAAPPAYKDALLSCTPDEIEYTAEVTGVNANFLTRSLEGFRAGNGKAWKDVWSGGHGVALMRDLLPAGQIVERLVQEYVDARADLP
jgi:nitronate monooxygenase